MGKTETDKKQAAGGDGMSHIAGTPTDGVLTAGKAAGHLRTVLHHKRLVAEGCFQVGLYWQGLTHDLSKFSPTEFLNGVRFYQNGVQSPNNGERVKKGYSEAWMHHKGRNRHHYEYWTDYSIEAVRAGRDPVQPVRMPRRYVAEMLMDRIAASKTYMERMLKILAKKGEKECFRFVRDYYLKGGKMR